MLSNYGLKLQNYKGFVKITRKNPKKILFISEVV